MKGRMIWREWKDQNEGAADGVPTATGRVSVLMGMLARGCSIEQTVQVPSMLILQKGI